MDKKTEFNINQVNAEDKQLKGLIDNGITQFNCADCDMALLVLQLTSTEECPESNVSTRVVVKCLGCGGFSYVKSIRGQFHPGAPSDNMAFDILEDNADSPEADVLFKAWSK